MPARDEAAEIVAHHYVNALGLAEAAGDHELHAELLEPTVRALKLAGDHALPLDVAAAEHYYDKAVRLAGDGRQLPSMLVAWSEALLQGGRLREAVEALDQGISGLRALGDDHAADAAAARSWYYHWSLADGKMLLSSEVMELAEATVASPELLAVLESCGERLSYNGRIKHSLQFADRALALCAELQLPESLRMVDLRGGDRCILGDVGGLDDFRHALELARARQAGHLTCVIAANLAEYLALFEGPGSALEAHLEALEMARQRQDQLATCFCRTGLFIDQIWAGQWDAALAEADGLLTFLEERDYLWDLPLAHATHAQLRAWRGDSAAAAEKAAWAEERSRETPLVATRVTCLMSSATVEAGLGNEGPALRLLNACGALLNDVEGMDAPCALRMPEAIRLAIDLGRPAVAHDLAQGLPAARPFDAATLTVLEALLCEHRGDHAEAAARFAAAGDRWRSLDVPYEQAHAHLGRGRCLTALGRSVEARAALSLARDSFAALGAQPALQKAQELLAVLGD